MFQTSSPLISFRRLSALYRLATHFCLRKEVIQYPFATQKQNSLSSHILQQNWCQNINWDVLMRLQPDFSRTFSCGHTLNLVENNSHANVMNLEIPYLNLAESIHRVDSFHLLFTLNYRLLNLPHLYGFWKYTKSLLCISKVTCHMKFEDQIKQVEIPWGRPPFSTATLIGTAVSALRKRGNSRFFAEDWPLVIGIQVSPMMEPARHQFPHCLFKTMKFCHDYFKIRFTLCALGIDIPLQHEPISTRNITLRLESAMWRTINLWNFGPLWNDSTWLRYFCEQDQTGIFTVSLTTSR